MGLMDIVSGVGNLLSAPVKVLSDWVEEPLKAIHARRDRLDKDKEVDREIKKESALSELRREEDAARVANQIKMDTEVEKIRAGIKLDAEKAQHQMELEKEQRLSEIRMNEDAAKVANKIKADTEAEKIRSEIALTEEKTRAQIETEKTRELSEIAMKEREHETDMQIKMQTEVNRINIEIQEWQKDQEVRRGKEIMEAVLLFQKAITELENDLYSVTGRMSIELKDNVLALENKWRQEYENFKKIRVQELREELKSNKEEFKDDPETLKELNAMTLEGIRDLTTDCRNRVESLGTQIKALSAHVDELNKSTHVALTTKLSELQGLGQASQNILSASNRNAIGQ